MYAVGAEMTVVYVCQNTTMHIAGHLVRAKHLKATIVVQYGQDNIGGYSDK